jgi:ABC-type multidrug transport system ATPase subunit
LIFLDEPTTGLDSTTALNLIKFLNRLAQAGRTVVTTIHQPSSEIFLGFGVILLMLDGHIVYHNQASASMQYFSNLGMPVPLHSNPMDHYMKLMNK